MAIRAEPWRSLGDWRFTKQSGQPGAQPGNFVEARARLEQALAIWRQVGDRWAIANTLTGLGDVAGEEKDYRHLTRCIYQREPGRSTASSATGWPSPILFEALGCLVSGPG